MRVLFEISARHLHITQEDFREIFGKDELTNFKNISQPGQFAAEEKVNLIGSKGRIDGVRILGPFRDKTQIELSVTDCYKIGVTPYLELSGSFENASSIEIEGPNGTITRDAAIVAKRHVHLSPESAEKLGVKTGDLVDIEVGGPRSVVFKNTVVRASESDNDSFQVDTDEANAAFAKNGSEAEILI